MRRAEGKLPLNRESMKEFDEALKCTRPQWSPNAPPRENLGIE